MSGSGVINIFYNVNNGFISKAWEAGTDVTDSQTNKT